MWKLPQIEWTKEDMIIPADFVLAPARRIKNIKISEVEKDIVKFMTENKEYIIKH